MNDELIDHLVRYFNGSNVALNSIGLAMPSRKQMSQDFFAMRTALGMDGYLDDEDAKKRLLAALKGKK